MMALLKKLPDWRESTRKVIMEGNFETFPIAGDLPRLLLHLSIVKENGEDLESLFPQTGKTDGKVKVNKDTTRRINAGDCLVAIQEIAKIFEGEQQRDKVTTEWNKLIDNEEDLSVQKTFLLRILKQVFVE